MFVFSRRADELTKDDVLMNLLVVDRVDRDDWAGEKPIGYESRVHVFFKNGTDQYFASDQDIALVHP